MLLGAGGKPDKVTVQQVLRAVADASEAVLSSQRFAIALVINIADWAPHYDVYIGTAKLDQQLKFACRYPSTAVKWIFAAQAKDAETVCSEAAE